MCTTSARRTSRHIATSSQGEKTGNGTPNRGSSPFQARTRTVRTPFSVRDPAGAPHALLSSGHVPAARGQPRRLRGHDGLQAADVRQAVVRDVQHPRVAGGTGAVTAVTRGRSVRCAEVCRSA